MSHVKGYGEWPHSCDQKQKHSQTLDSRGTFNQHEECAISMIGAQIRKNSAVDALTLAQEEPIPDVYSQSDGRVIQGWKDSRSRVAPTVEVHPGTVQPVYKWSIGSPASQRHGRGGSAYATYGRQPRGPGRYTLERAETLAEDIMGQQPECPVCMEAYCDDLPARVPRNLQCGHSCCTGCLKSILGNNITSSSVTCPKCQRPTLVPGGNVDQLARNYALMEVIRSLPKSRSSSPETARRAAAAAVSSSADPGPPSDTLNDKCPDHGDHLTSYCVNDGKLICSTCLVYGSHSGHKTLGIKEAVKENRKKLSELNPEVLQQRRRMEVAVADVEAVCESVQKTGGEVVKSIEDEFHELVELIEERKNQLKVEAMQRTQIRVKALKEQARDLHENIEISKAVHNKVESVIKMDDCALLQESILTMDQIEGVFINPPPTQPRARDDLRCQFSPDPKEEIAAHLAGYGTITSEVGTITNLRAQPYHDGIRISWLGHDFADNTGITYHLQMATSKSSSYSMIYRGSSTKYTWKTDLEYNTCYMFRVQVRTTEGVGNWSQPVNAMKAAPSFRWHDSWRNVKIELSSDKLEASWSKGAHHRYWATFAADKVLEETKQHYMELEVVEFGKQKPQKRLAIGVVACSKKGASSLPWHDGQNPVGHFEDVKSWSFHPISGVKNSYALSNEGKPYASNISLQEGDKIGMLVDGPAKKLMFFLNGQDLGVAFDGLDTTALLPVVSIRDKIKVRLRFPPPPYVKRSVKLIQLRSSTSFD